MTDRILQRRLLIMAGSVLLALVIAAVFWTGEAHAALYALTTISAIGAAGCVVWLQMAKPKHQFAIWSLILSLVLGAMAALLSIDDASVELSLYSGIGSFILFQTACILLIIGKCRKKAASG
jgi:hypothetical protein